MKIKHLFNFTFQRKCEQLHNILNVNIIVDISKTICGNTHWHRQFVFPHLLFSFYPSLFSINVKETEKCFLYLEYNFFFILVLTQEVSQQWFLGYFQLHYLFLQRSTVKQWKNNKNYSLTWDSVLNKISKRSRWGQIFTSTKRVNIVLS